MPFVSGLAHLIGRLSGASSFAFFRGFAGQSAKEIAKGLSKVKSVASIPAQAVAARISQAGTKIWANRMTALGVSSSIGSVAYVASTTTSGDSLTDDQLSVLKEAASVIYEGELVNDITLAIRDITIPVDKDSNNSYSPALVAEQTSQMLVSTDRAMRELFNSLPKGDSLRFLTTTAILLPSICAKASSSSHAPYPSRYLLSLILTATAELGRDNSQKVENRLEPYEGPKIKADRELVESFQNSCIDADKVSSIKQLERYSGITGLNSFGVPHLSIFLELLKSVDSQDVVKYYRVRNAIL